MTDAEILALQAAITPGPWVLNPPYAGNGVDVMSNFDPATKVGDYVAEVGTSEVPGPDARLIAAAPELLAEVIRLRAEIADKDAKIARLTRILAVERGDATVAPEGWRARVTSWGRGMLEVSRGHGIIGAGWHFSDYAKKRSLSGGPYPTALEAMEAADAALETK